MSAQATAPAHDQGAVRPLIFCYGVENRAIQCVSFAVGCRFTGDAEREEHFREECYAELESRFPDWSPDQVVGWYVSAFEDMAKRPALPD